MLSIIEHNVGPDSIIGGETIPVSLLYLRDHMDTLGLDWTIALKPQEERMKMINKASRRMALFYHPDKIGVHDEELEKRVNEAKKMLIGSVQIMDQVFTEYQNGTLFCIRNSTEKSELVTSSLRPDITRPTFREWAAKGRERVKKRDISDTESRKRESVEETTFDAPTEKDTPINSIAKMTCGKNRKMCLDSVLEESLRSYKSKKDYMRAVSSLQSKLGFDDDKMLKYILSDFDVKDRDTLYPIFGIIKSIGTQDPIRITTVVTRVRHWYEKNID